MYFSLKDSTQILDIFISQYYCNYSEDAEWVFIHYTLQEDEFITGASQSHEYFKTKKNYETEKARRKDC